MTQRRKEKPKTGEWARKLSRFLVFLFFAPLRPSVFAFYYSHALRIIFLAPAGRHVY